MEEAQREKDELLKNMALLQQEKEQLEAETENLQKEYEQEKESCAQLRRENQVSRVSLRRQIAVPAVRKGKVLFLAVVKPLLSLYCSCSRVIIVRSMLLSCP